MAHQTRSLKTDEANSSALHMNPFPPSYREHLGRVVTVTFADAIDVRADSSSTVQRYSQDGSLEDPSSKVQRYSQDGSLQAPSSKVQRYSQDDPLEAFGTVFPKRRPGIIHFDRSPLLVGIEQFDGPTSKSETSLSDTSQLSDSENSELYESGRSGASPMSSSSSMTLTPGVTSQSESDDVNGDEEDNLLEERSAKSATSATSAKSATALRTPMHTASSRPIRDDTKIDYRQRLYPSSAIPEFNYPSNDYVTSPYPVSEFPDSTFPTSPFPSSDFPTVDFPASRFPKSEFPLSKLPPSDFPICEFPSSDFPTS